MGSLKLTTASSGSVTIEPTNTASNYTLTAPATNATLAINGPAFSAYLDVTQAISNNTFTKINIDTEVFDTNNNFASSRFTPTVAGYYQVNGYVTTATSGRTSGGYQASIFKNGVLASGGSTNPYLSTVNPSSSTSTLVYLNGSTDYVELYLYQFSGSTDNNGAYRGIGNTGFSASMVRAA